MIAERFACETCSENFGYVLADDPHDLPEVYGLMVQHLMINTDHEVVRRIVWREGSGVPAYAILTATGTALTDGDQVVMGDRIYVYKTVLTGAKDEVLIGAATESLANLKAAANGEAGKGITYGLSTVAHAIVHATLLTGTTELRFEARANGVAGNDIVKLTTSSNLSWDDGQTFSGGLA